MITAEELRQRRLSAGLTQAELAEKFGVAVRSIRNWEAHGVPSQRTELVLSALPELPEPLFEQQSTRCSARKETSEGEAMFAAVSHVVSFFHSAIRQGASRATVNRAVSATIATLEETRALEVLDWGSRQALISLLTAGLPEDYGAKEIPDDYELAAHDLNPDEEMGEHHTDNA